MLIKSYTKEIFRPKCNPGFESLHCIAYLENDIKEVLPYINAELGGFQYTKDPPSVTFKLHGKLITVHSDKIAINALRDEREAERILKWLIGEINRVWENRDRIKPRYVGISTPQVIEILKLLPKTNCRRCGRSTCLVFAILVSEGVKSYEDCPALEKGQKKKLRDYLNKFQF